MVGLSRGETPGCLAPPKEASVPVSGRRESLAAASSDTTAVYCILAATIAVYSRPLLQCTRGHYCSVVTATTAV